MKLARRVNEYMFERGQLVDAHDEDGRLYAIGRIVWTNGYIADVEVSGENGVKCEVFNCSFLSRHTGFLGRTVR